LLGIVKKMLENSQKYLVEDGVGDVEEVDRYDIITDDDDAAHIIKVSLAILVLLRPSNNISGTRN